MGQSGVPELKNGVEIGFTDFSELAVGPGLPAALTAFGIGADSPTAVAIARDPEEGNYFSMSGQGVNAWGYGYDAFNAKIDSGEILARVYCTFPGLTAARRAIGGAASMSGLIGIPEVGPDFDCWTGSLFYRSGVDIEISGVNIDNGNGSIPLNAVDLQEDFQNPKWVWIRIRRVPNGGTPANDDWTGTAWYGAYRDEPASPDGTALNQTRVISGSAAAGWAITAPGDLSEQRIAYLAYSGDPTTEPPPPPVVFDDFPDPAPAPRTVGDLWGSGALKDVGPSGLIQTRPTKAAGWSWNQTWGRLSVRNLVHMELISFLERSWDRGVVFDVRHPLVPGSGLAPNGLGASGVLVDGAGQLVGSSSLLTRGWPAATSDVARGGDAVKIGGDSAVYLVAEAAASNGAGEATLEITPPLRKSPVDGATVATRDVTFRVVASARSQFEASRRPLDYEGYAATLTEALT